MKGLYAIVDIPQPHGLDAATVCRAVLGGRGAGGASAVQLRAKGATTAQRLELLRAMAPACRAASVPLLVNDDVDAALAGIEGVVGLHLGQDDPGVDRVWEIRDRARAAGLAELSIGVSTHDLDQARAAARREVDYIGFGPVAETTSKAKPDPVVGFDGLLEACRAVSRPVVAIGGLDEAGARRAVEIGASAVAMIGALVDASAEGIERRAIQIAQSLAKAARPLRLDEVAARLPVLEKEQLVELARWSDDIMVLRAAGLPARFRPWIAEGTAWYRPSDVLDLMTALGKGADESWEQWSARVADSPPSAGALRLRLRT